MLFSIARKSITSSLSGCPLREEKSFSQRAFFISTDIRKPQDKAKTSYTLSTRRLRFGYVWTKVWGIGIPIKRLTRRYAVAIKWRYGNTWVDLALIYEPSYIYKRWRCKIQGVREKNLELDTKTYYFLY